jgi:AraC-like DNA-binding protein
MATRAGFRHVSHLSASFKSAFGLTPREGVRRYRHGR